MKFLSFIINDLFFLFNLKQKKYNSTLVINNLLLLSQSHASVMVFFKKIFKTKKLSCTLLSYKYIKWKIIYEIKNLLNLIVCIHCVTSLWLVDSSSYVFFSSIECFFFTNLIFQRWVSWRFSFLAFLFKIIPASFQFRLT